MDMNDEQKKGYGGLADGRGEASQAADDKNRPLYD